MKKSDKIDFNEYHITSSHTYDEMREIILNACQGFNCIMSKRLCENIGERQLVLFYYKSVRFPYTDQLVITLSECPDGSTNVTASSVPLWRRARYRHCSYIMDMFIKNIGYIGEKIYLSPAQRLDFDAAEIVIIVILEILFLFLMFIFGPVPIM